MERGDSIYATYTTTGHTGTMIPLFAYGPGSERFAGMHTAAEVGATLKSLIRPD
jgi:alkaline phosphatase